MNKKNTNKLLAMTCILLSLLTSACGGGGGAAIAPAEDTVIKGKA